MDKTDWNECGVHAHFVGVLLHLVRLLGEVLLAISQHLVQLSRFRLQLLLLVLQLQRPTQSNVLKHSQLSKLKTRVNVNNKPFDPSTF